MTDTNKIISRACPRCFALMVYQGRTTIGPAEGCSKYVCQACGMTEYVGGSLRSDLSNVLCPKCGAKFGEPHAPTCGTGIAPPRVAILEEGIKLTAPGGDRDADYGDPVDNMQHIADVYNALTKQKISARDVAILHEITKQCRRYNNPLHRDSYVDDGPYVGIQYECALAEAKHVNMKDEKDG